MGAKSFIIFIPVVYLTNCSVKSLFSQKRLVIFIIGMSYRVLDEVTKHGIVVNTFDITEEHSVELHIVGRLRCWFEKQHVKHFAILRLVVHYWLLVSQKQRCNLFEECFTDLSNCFGRILAIFKAYCPWEFASRTTVVAVLIAIGIRLCLLDARIPQIVIIFSSLLHWKSFIIFLCLSNFLNETVLVFTGQTFISSVELLVFDPRITVTSIVNNRGGCLFNAVYLFATTSFQELLRPRWRQVNDNWWLAIIRPNVLVQNIKYKILVVCNNTNHITKGLRHLVQIIGIFVIVLRVIVRKVRDKYCQLKGVNKTLQSIRNWQ